MNHKGILKDAFKGCSLDLDKVIPPHETVRRLRERLKTINLKILKKTERIDNGRLDIPVYFSVCGSDAQAVTGTNRQMGKGGIPSQAEASAVMELIERFSLLSFKKDAKNFFIEKYRNIKDLALPFEIIARSVHDNSTDIKREEEIFQGLPLKWTKAFNLTRGEDVLIPFDWFYAINAHNGPSAGNCAEEAILQGLCEVVERHVSSIISRDRIKTPHIDIGSVTDPLARELIQKYINAGIKLYVHDFSLNTGIPSVGVLGYDPSTFPDRSEIIWTAGTTPDPQKALLRALTEVAQLAGDFNTSSCYEPSGLPKFKDLDEADFIIDHKKKVGITDLPDISDKNIKVEIENCVSALNKWGMEVLVVDITHPLLGIPACYVIIPGAHFRERAAGGSVGMFSARLITESGDPFQAIENLKKMDKLLPGKYYTRFFLGMSHLSIDEPLKALEYFEESIKTGPLEQDIPSIYSYMGVSLKELGRYNDAVDVLKKAEEYDRERTDIYNLLGFCYFKLKKHEKAIESFQKVLRLNPGSAIDYANIASNYREMGERESAVQYYRLALQLDPSIVFARENLEKLEQ
ncbi:MAG: hypothetical protein B1H11_01760 [Desulfobacteraceae bacterium 4484_190.1]|nr:MAG: hypothetical protein B1H11_01760 [Desulfobacteraceae bacterium 4484_190.1]